jgi:hypothetical protein
MSDTCGPMSGMPLAQYDRDGRCWKTSEVTSLWALPMSSLTLPTWGCLHDGALYELPTPALPTIERDCSSLPTPTSQAAKHPTMDDRGPGTPDDANLWSVVGRLLPTPAVNGIGAGKDPQAWDDWTERMKQAHGNGNGHGKSLEQEALRMLPTPTTMDAKATNTPAVAEKFRDNNQNCLTYEIALLGANTRLPLPSWEHAIGRPAPAPTVQRNNRDRLSPAFVEWMMGLPEGHVTGHGLSPSAELKMLGNGVVPQQARLALQLLGGVA